MRLRHSFKSTQWVMWSSPLLLLVLVFTLSASNGAPLARSTLGHPASTTTTTSTTSTTSTVGPTTRTTIAGITTSTTSPTTTTTSPPHPPATVATTTSTSGRRAGNSSHKTVTSVATFASAPGESASNGALRGTITPVEGLAVVPLDGPGTWSVQSSAPVTTTLDCGASAVTVESPFVVGAGEDCQLTLAPSDASRVVTWELTPE